MDTYYSKREADKPFSDSTAKRQRVPISEQILARRSLLESVIWATTWHKDQVRGEDNVPYLLHSLRVANLILLQGVPDYVVEAAILHEVLPMRAIDKATFRKVITSDVADLVEELDDSETNVEYMGLSRCIELNLDVDNRDVVMHEGRRACFIFRFPRLSSYALLIALASIIDNISDMPSLLPSALPERQVPNTKLGLEESLEYAKLIYDSLDTLPGHTQVLTESHSEMKRLIETNLLRLGYKRTTEAV